MVLNLAQTEHLLILKGFLGMGMILVKSGSGETVIVEHGTRHKYSVSSSVSIKRCHGHLDARTSNY